MELVDVTSYCFRFIGYISTLYQKKKLNLETIKLTQKAFPLLFGTLSYSLVLLPIGRAIGTAINFNC